MRLLISLASLCLLSSLHLNAQQPDLPNRKNSVAVFYGGLDLSINYERTLNQSTKHSLRARGGIGYWSDFDWQGNYFSPSIIYLLGSRNHHLELNGGIKIVNGKKDSEPGKSTFIIPDFFGGYRFEPPQGRMFVKLGLAATTYIGPLGGFGVRF